MFATRHNPAQPLAPNHDCGQHGLRQRSAASERDGEQHPLATLLPISAVIAAIIVALLISAARQPLPALDSYHFGASPAALSAPRPLPAYARVADPRFSGVERGGDAAIAPRAD